MTLSRAGSYILPIFCMVFLVAGFLYPAHAKKEGFNEGRGIIESIATAGGLSIDKDPALPIMRAIGWLLSLVAVLALGALVWGSIMYILSLGNDQRAETAKKIILYAIIGVLLSGISFLIIRVLQTIIAPSTT